MSKKELIILVWDVILILLFFGIAYVITHFNLSDFIVWGIVAWLAYLTLTVAYKSDKA